LGNFGGGYEQEDIIINKTRLSHPNIEWWDEFRNKNIPSLEKEGID